MDAFIAHMLKKALKHAQNLYGNHVTMSDLKYCYGKGSWKECLLFYHDLGTSMLYFNYVREDGREATHAVEEIIYNEEKGTNGQKDCDCPPKTDSYRQGSVPGRTKDYCEVR